MTRTRDTVLRRRLATQRLTGPALRDAADVVRQLLAVQAQEPATSRFSLGLRMRHGTDDAVRRAIDTGAILRTHVLRPTWHYVAAEDLRWLLDLTSPKVDAAMAARHRQLGIDGAVRDRAFAAFGDALSGGTYLTRRQLHAALTEYSGEQLGHLLLLAELSGLVCSGPFDGTQHTYALVDERVAPATPLDRDDAIRTLVRRFAASHGPVSERDLTRWTVLTLGEIRTAIADLAPELDSVRDDDATLWFAPEALTRTTRRTGALLLPTFDEAYLSYRDAGFPRSEGHPYGSAPVPVNEGGAGGAVICGLREVGRWNRSLHPPYVDVTLAVDPAADRDAITEAVDRLARFTGLEPRLHRA